MMVMLAVFVMMGYWKIPELNLELRGTLTGWLVVLAACAQFATVAVMARRVTEEQALTGPLVKSKIIGLFIFIGVIFGASRLEGITPPQLNLILMLGINAIATATVVGILLTPKPSEETENAE